MSEKTFVLKNLELSKAEAGNILTAELLRVSPGSVPSGLCGWLRSGRGSLEVPVEIRVGSLERERNKTQIEKAQYLPTPGVGSRHMLGTGPTLLWKVG